MTASASMISDDPPYKLVFVFVCLCVYVDMCLSVVEPSGFRVLGFFRCLGLWTGLFVCSFAWTGA